MRATLVVAACAIGLVACSIACAPARLAPKSPLRATPPATATKRAPVDRARIEALVRFAIETEHRCPDPLRLGHPEDVRVFDTHLKADFHANMASPAAHDYKAPRFLEGAPVDDGGRSGRYRYTGVGISRDGTLAALGADFDPVVDGEQRGIYHGRVYLARLAPDGTWCIAGSVEDWIE